VVAFQRTFPHGWRVLELVDTDKPRFERQIAVVVDGGEHMILSFGMWGLQRCMRHLCLAARKGVVGPIGNNVQAFAEDNRTLWVDLLEGKALRVDLLEGKALRVDLLEGKALWVDLLEGKAGKALRVDLLEGKALWVDLLEGKALWVDLLEGKGCC